MDKRDPVCGMQGTIQADGHWFCSDRCVAIYRSRGRQEVRAARWAAHRPLLLAGAGVALLLVASLFVPGLVPMRQALLEYARLMAGPVALGLLLGGALDYYVPREYVAHWLARPGAGSIARAVGLGFLASACSHGILALAVELYRKGASAAATVAFLLASPWANLPVTILLFGFFGWPALGIVAAAIVVALVTGLGYQWLERRGWVERNPHGVEPRLAGTLWDDMRARWRANPLTFQRWWREDLPGVMRGSIALADMVLWWMLIGAALASAIAAYVPSAWMHRYMGPTPGGLLVTLAAATVIEVCSEGSAPLAFEIYRHGGIGNAYVFLMGGVVTDYTEIGLLWANIGRRAALWLPALTVPQVFLIGWLFNRFM